MCYNITMKKIIIVSGISGAGKTMTSNILEDKGYRCIDQYPPELFEDLIELIEHDDSTKYDNIVLTVSLSDLDRYNNTLKNTNIKPTLIFIDADKETVINRYKFTRRVHPLLISNVASSLEEAIDIEKGILNKYKKFGKIIDTTHLSSKQLNEKLNDALEATKDVNLSLTFISFGFKKGIPYDADNVFDVRFLDNPFYDPKLKTKTGNDKAVKEFVLNKPRTQRYLKKLIAYIDFMIKSYDKEEKRHLTICVGCTGGQHRSVVITNYLYQYYKKDYTCYYKHRELKK